MVLQLLLILSEYSFKQYLDGKQNNERANYLYNGDYIPLVKGEEYSNKEDQLMPMTQVKVFIQLLIGKK